MSKKFNCHIRWGEANARRELYEKGDKGPLYEFDTMAELNAFLEGVNEAEGWMDSVCTEVNGVVVEPDDEIYDDEDTEDAS